MCGGGLPLGLVTPRFAASYGAVMFRFAASPRLARTRRSASSGHGLPLREA
jgi:hypothetical protein